MDDEIRKVDKSYNRETYVGRDPVAGHRSLQPRVRRRADPVAEVVKEHKKSRPLRPTRSSRSRADRPGAGAAPARDLHHQRARDEVNPAGVYATKHKFRGEKESFKIRDDFKPKPAISWFTSSGRARSSAPLWLQI